MLGVGIWGVKCQVRRYFSLAMATWKFSASTTFEISHFQPVQFAGKNPTSPKYLTNVQKLCFSSKMLRVGIWLEKFRCAGNLLLQWQGENFAHRQHLKFCPFRPVHRASKNPLSPKVFNRFSKTLIQLEDVEDWHLGGKFQVRRYFIFAMARWWLCASPTFQISHFHPIRTRLY